MAKEVGHNEVECTLKYQRCDEKKLTDDFPSYKAVIDSNENSAIKKTSPKKTSPKSYYTPHYAHRQMN